MAAWQQHRSPLLAPASRRTPAALLSLAWYKQMLMDVAHCEGVKKCVAVSRSSHPSLHLARQQLVLEARSLLEGSSKHSIGHGKGLLSAVDHRLPPPNVRRGAPCRKEAQSSCADEADRIRSGASPTKHDGLQQGRCLL